MLAAGASTRLPGPKQLLRYRGATLLRHAAQTAVKAACGPVVVVLGAKAAAKQLRFELVDLAVTVAENVRWQDGIATSIRAGLETLEAGSPTDAVIFMTCDQPHVEPSLLRQMVNAFARTRPPAVACAYAGTVGVPALFARELYGELRALEGDQGAKGVLERRLAQVARIPFERGTVDIDTPEDVAKLSGGH